ncbi:UDP-glucose/GDP-mannose dehydrogenase family protein [Pseudomonas sp. S75]|uniref:UDP-glucose dehydrogenase family protein n=1 Tax=unclassified Pseudomonas TaxID=196821 RepID=UPI001903B9F1|nr:MULTISPECIES: UDP-glucose/GDP-mannose dehydrogenase family protein [unclassified Pseudomonas]MBJ9976486.1 UDP-glucose/GDP-mannose dehydrogenase family protein [Pseudomonas sp. S30]MBK0155614.1 UDP-glucose/GDP-mannose dehydrogenase family protein [Pseudomonas sp. S75]
MDVSVFGTGYVGLVQAAALADVGHRVLCVDVDAHKINQLRQGVPPISEPGLADLLEDNTRDGRLLFSTQASDAVSHAELIFIAVGTPPDEDGSADLSHVLDVTRQIAELMTADRTLIVKSTVPVGTADQVLKLARECLRSQGKEQLNVRVVSNPEFLKEGTALADCMRPDRIIVGTHDPIAHGQLAELYAPFCRNHEKLMFMDNRSAELTKYAANAMLATRISFMNELANLSEHLGADIEAVRRGIGSDPRIGYHFIYPGCGFGGSCFPKDIRALLHTAEHSGMPLRLLQSVNDVNDRQRRILFAKLEQRLGGLAGTSIALWGLAFKPNTDDMREAPSRYLMEALWAAGATVRAYDPEAMDECRRLYGYRDDLQLCATRDDTLQDADALVICTEWKNFRVVDFALLASKLRARVIVDGRNLYNPEQVAAHGLHYTGIGLRHIAPDQLAAPMGAA